MQTKSIAVWDGTGEAVDYQMKDRDYGTGDRVRVIAVNQRREFIRSGRGYHKSVANDGVLYVRLNDDGTPAKKYDRWTETNPTADHLDVRMTMPRYITQEWDTAVDQIEAARLRKIRADQDKARRAQNVANLVTRANVLLESAGTREIHRYDTDQYGNVKLSPSQFHTLIELAEGELANHDYDSRSQDS